jgi:hypothetical protein
MFLKTRMALTIDELAKAKNYGINLNLNTNGIRYSIKEYEFTRTTEYKKFEQIQEQLINRPNVTVVGLASNIGEPIVIHVGLNQPDSNFPTEIDGFKIKVEVNGGISYYN